MHKYLRSVNVQWGKIVLDDIKKMRFENSEIERYSIRHGDLLICEGGEVGRSAVWEYNFESLYQNALHRVRFYGECSPHFFQSVMSVYDTLGILHNNSQGVTIKHLTKTSLCSLLFPLPPIAEQKRIVAALSQYTQIIQQIQE